MEPFLRILKSPIKSKSETENSQKKLNFVFQFLFFRKFGFKKWIWRWTIEKCVAIINKTPFISNEICGFSILQPKWIFNSRISPYNYIFSISRCFRNQRCYRNRNQFPSPFQPVFLHQKSASETKVLHILWSFVLFSRVLSRNMSFFCTWKLFHNLVQFNLKSTLSHVIRLFLFKSPFFAVFGFKTSSAICFFPSFFRFYLKIQTSERTSGSAMIWHCWINELKGAHSHFRWQLLR